MDPLQSFAIFREGVVAPQRKILTEGWAEPGKEIEVFTLDKGVVCSGKDISDGSSGSADRIMGPLQDRNPGCGTAPNSGPMGTNIAPTITGPDGEMQSWRCGQETK